jgi:hypothetical protein
VVADIRRRKVGKLLHVVRMDWTRMGKKNFENRLEYKRKMDYAQILMAKRC